MIESSSLPINNIPEFKEKLLYWANKFPVFICLDNNEVESPFQQEEFLVAIDQVKQLSLSTESKQFEQLKAFQQSTSSTIYGYLSYDLKNEIEDLQSKNTDELNFPSLYFFEARYTFSINEGRCTINRSTLEALQLIEQIEAIQINQNPIHADPLKWESRMEKKEYLNHIKKIQHDIIEGTVYELNFCREIYVNTNSFKSLEAFVQINHKAKAPFSSYLKMEDKQILCFSPERFMKHESGRVISQPIKGTVKKGKSVEENEALKKALLNDEKERAENVMIVDLVRNDFARSSKPGSVNVDELFGIYEFENIIQMVSTVSAELREDIHPLDALKNAYPMGSMTGAPKIKAMQLIEAYEQTKRGVYSGALGYIKPNLDFDFNVLIRTLIYDESKHYLSLHIGGAITYDAIPEKEWEETCVKAKSILDFL
jgi:para-aminobenzoate synthetase component 1